MPIVDPPSLAIDTHRISYQVTATHKQWLKTTAAMLPLIIVDARPAPARIRPPQVGSEDVAAFDLSIALSWTRPANVFIAGLPMKRATNALAGRS